MVYTTYFAKIKTLPKNIQPISIALWPPRGWVGISYPKLAPTKSILLQYKQNPSQKIYAERYRKEVLDKLDPQGVRAEWTVLPPELSADLAGSVGTVRRVVKETQRYALPPKRVGLYASPIFL